MEKIIGDYKLFFSNILHDLKKLKVDVKEIPLSHICYRTSTVGEYKKLRNQLLPFCTQQLETQFNGRPISLLLLKTPLILGNYSVSLIELPSPREAHTYPSGLEHVGFVVGKNLTNFKKQYKDVWTGEKDRTYYKIPFITFRSGATAKFYEKSLKEIVESEGWNFSS